MEDIKIGRRKRYQTDIVSVAAALAPQLVFGRDAKRTHFRVCFDVDNCTLYTRNVGGASGFVLLFSSTPSRRWAEFELELHGEMVTDEFYAQGTGAAGIAHCVATYLPDGFS